MENGYERPVHRPGQRNGTGHPTGGTEAHRWPGSDVRLAFKWADNLQQGGDPLEFIVNGDAAPNGRFNYVYR